MDPHVGRKSGAYQHNVFICFLGHTGNFALHEKNTSLSQQSGLALLTKVRIGKMCPFTMTRHVLSCARRAFFWCEMRRPHVVNNGVVLYKSYGGVGKPRALRMVLADGTSGARIYDISRGLEIPPLIKIFTDNLSVVRVMVSSDGRFVLAVVDMGSKG